MGVGGELLLQHNSRNVNGTPNGKKIIQLTTIKSFGMVKTKDAKLSY